MYSIRRFPLSFSSCTIDVAHTPDTLINNQNFIHMTKHLRYLFAALLVWICTVGGYAQDLTEIYSTGFEESEGYTLASTYTGATTVGPSGKQWYINSGCVSKTSFISGASSIHMRYYKSTKKTPYAQMNFSVDGVSNVTFKGNTAGSGNIKVEYSTDNGTTWVGAKEYTLSSTVSDISYELSSSNINNVRIKITSLITSDKKAVCIDDFKLLAKSGSSSSATPTTTTFNTSDGLNVDDQTFNLVNGKYNGEAFAGYKAACTTDGAEGTIKYTSSEESVATVGTDGALTIVGIGTTEITATFVPNDAAAYATSSAKYTVINSEPAKTATSLSFGADKDGSIVALIEGLLSNGSDFTGYTATESTGAAGTISYAATGDGVATVDAATGALTVNKTTYGTTTITATFTPNDAETYAASTATYKITNEKKVDESTIVFDCTKYSQSIVGSYKTNTGTARQFPSVAGKDYTFTLTACMFNSGVQMQASGGKIVSPVFTSFPNGYKVVVTYAQNAPTLTSSELSDAKSVSNTSAKTLTLELPSSSATFTIKAGSSYSQIQRIELTALTPKTDPALSFANPTQEVELKDELVDIQTLTKPADLAADAITYVSSDNTIAEVTEGFITLKKTGEVTIKATSAATDIYSAGTAEYTLKVVDNRAEAPVSVKESAVTLNLSAGEYNASENITNEQNLALAYAIDNDEYQIDETGYVIFDKVGSATISVSFVGNETYKPFTGSFTLNVEESRTEDAAFKFDAESYDIDLADEAYADATFDANAKLQNPNGLTYTWTITPTTNGESIDASGNATGLKRGTYTITATSETDNSYLATTATCQLVVKNSAVEEQAVEFVAGTDKGTQSEYKENNEDNIVKSYVKIHATNAALAANVNNVYTYRLYKSSNTTISIKIGKILKIEFVGSGNSEKNNSLKNLSTEDKQYSATDPNYGVWTGSAQSVTFTASAQARATNIIVTLELPKAKAYTFSDDASTITLEDYDNANVTINRKLKADDGWWTLCLPFALDADQMKAYFGDGAQLRTFDSMNGTTMNFKAATAMEAGKPYLVKPTKNFDGTTTPFECVQLKAADPAALGTGYAMIGTYHTETLATDGTDLFLGANNKFYKPSEGGNTIKGFRVYFQCPADKTGMPMTANIDGVETAITRIDGEQLGSTTDTRVYNLQGQCVGNTLRGLASGIYVCGGRKVVVK